MPLGGESVGTAYVRLIADGNEVPDDIRDTLDKLDPVMDQAGKDHAKTYSESWTKTQEKEFDKFSKGFGQKFQRSMKGFSGLDNDTDRISNAVGRLTSRIDKSDGFTRRWINFFHSGLQKLNVELDKSAERTGKMFGKGSRNDFLNIVGASIEGIHRIVNAAGRGAEALAGLFTGKGGSGGGFDFAKIAATLGSSIAGIAIALGAIALAAGPLAALISGIGAAIISLAGSLAFAAGAIGGVAAGLTGVLVPALGVALLAFTHLGNEGTKAISKIRDDLGDLGKVAGDAIGPGLTKAANSLAPAFRRLTPLVEATSGAIGNVIASLAQVADSAAFRKFTNAFETFLPRAINQLGTAVGQLAEGLLGVFRAAIPITQDFLDWLVKITREFSEWANSAKGQNELKQFFDDAADSAKAVWDFVVQLGDAITELLSAGKDTGDSLFQEAADNLREFVEWLQDPKNQKSIQEFFENGSKVAEQLGQAIIVIGDAIGRLDNAFSRIELGKIFEGAFFWIESMATGIEAAQQAMTGLWRASQFLMRLPRTIGDLFGKIDFSGIGRSANHIFGLIQSEAQGTVHRITTYFSGLARRLANAAGNFPWSKIITNYTPRVVGWFAGLARRLANAAGNFIWSTVITNYVPRVVGWFAGMAGRLARAAGNFAWNTVIKNYVPTVLGWFSDLAHRLVNAVGNFDWSSIITNPTDTIVGWFRSLHDTIAGFLSFSVHIDWPSPPSWLDKVTATGGIFAGAQTRIIGEAGPEAVVPLNRPLNMVDPSVRWLSAIAQGKQMAPGEGAPTQSGRSVNVSEGAITVVEAANGVATAQAVLNALVARAV